MPSKAVQVLCWSSLLATVGKRQRNITEFVFALPAQTRRTYYKCKHCSPLNPRSSTYDSMQTVSCPAVQWRDAQDNKVQLEFHVSLNMDGNT